MAAARVSGSRQVILITKMFHMPKRLQYKSENIVVTYDLKKCIHAAKCVHGLPSVFDPNKKPWVEPANASADELAAVIHTCPSGALQYERLDGGRTEPAPEVNVVSLEKDGPIHVTGNIRIVDHEGTTIETGARFTLCRCGDSSNRPFCDLSHKKEGFKAGASLGTGGIKGDASDTDSGVLTITTSQDGPLLFNGPMTISCSAEGDDRSGSKSALCRCGQSSNKPFCDGTHRTAGFQASDLAVGE